MKSESHVAFVIIGGGLISLVLLFLVVLLCVAYFRMGEIFKYLRNSPGVRCKVGYLGWDPISRFLFISYIGSLMLFSRRMVKLGELDLQDYKLFPGGLKKTIVFAFGSMLALGVFTIVYVLVGRFMGWLE